MCCCVLKGMEDVQVKAAATDIFSYLVEFSPSMVREFVMQEPQQADDVSLSQHNEEHQNGFYWFEFRDNMTRIENGSD